VSIDCANARFMLISNLSLTGQNGSVINI